MPRLRIEGGPALAFWEAEWVRQRYRPGTNVVVVEAEFSTARAKVVYAAHGEILACRTWASEGARVVLPLRRDVAEARLRCDDSAARSAIRAAERSDRGWLARARPLGNSAPAWAEQMYLRSLLTLRALTDRRTGAAAAGARDGWAYVWPRDAGTVALAFAVSGYRTDAARVAGFLLGLDLDAAARFHDDGSPVPGRAAQGDANGWVAGAAAAAGLRAQPPPLPWRERADYQEGESGNYLGNALAGGAPAAALREFEARGGLVRTANDPGSGLDSAAAWAVRPFARPALYRAARRTMLHLAADRTRFGITPGSGWQGGKDPWTAPTAWVAWSLAALGDRRTALGLLATLRRAATSAGALPERVDAETGVPSSTTPLAWPHALAILTLRELWP